MKSKVPKIMHCIWVWPLPPPMKWINSWKEKHPDWEYILRGNEELENIARVNKNAMNAFQARKKRAGIADCMRYEILYQYGWILHAADSMCLNSVDELFETGHKNYVVDTSHKEWHELLEKNKNSVAPLYACKAGSELAKDLIEAVGKVEKYISPALTVWNRLMQKLLNSWKDYNVKTRPQHLFLPTHYNWYKYEGKDKVYATHFWGTTKWTYKQWL